MVEKIDNFKPATVTILGGGTAGWLVALYITKHWPSLDVTVLEDPSKPPIIAGESGGNALTVIYDQIGVNIKDWVHSVNATPKLGGTFYGWNGKDSVFYHSLITEYTKCWSQDFPSIEERYYYLRGLIGANIPIADAVPTGRIMKENKIPFYKDLSLFQNTRPMWHFDSRENADYLKNFAIDEGIKLVEGQYTHSTKNNNGELKSIHLSDGRELESDWYFDCSGFARLLLEKEMNVEKDILTDYFPASAVLPWWDEPCLNSSTVATTMDAGWTWKIGLTHRTGQGYLYDPNVLTDDQALAEIHKKFGNHIEPVARLKFTPTIFKQSMRKNVIGIGLSTGFMEPLEANGTGVIVDALLALKETWNPFDKVKTREDEFNKKVYHAYNVIKDFLSLHYRGKGNGSDFWKEQSNPIHTPDSLKERLEEWEVFYRTGKIDLNHYMNQFSIESWLTVIQGLDIIDSSLINLEEIKPFILDYYEREKELSKVEQDACLGIEEWNKIIN
jgi:tryptophan halogenase